MKTLLVPVGRRTLILLVIWIKTHVVFIIQVPAEVTLITPVECKHIWKQFVGEMEASFAQAKEVEVLHDFVIIL